MMIKSTTQTNDSQDARRLLTQWGAAPLLYFGLLPDKRYLKSGPGERPWGIAYRVQGHHALVLGDPFGDPHAVSDAVDAFLALCRRHGWRPAFYQTTRDNLETYKDAGLSAVKVGEDAQIALAGFSLAGKRYLKMRNDLRRIEKAGVVLETYGPDTLPPAACVAEMEEISHGWRKAHRATEGTFAMGGFDPTSQLFAESRYLIARDTNTGQMLAFTTFVPVFGAEAVRGWTLDLMRRRADALHGVMDFLIVSAATQFAAEGEDVLSLGLSPLAGDDDPTEAAATSRVRRFLYTRLNRAYNFQGLHTFKSKFATHWEPRYLVYKSNIALAATSAAILKAHTTVPKSASAAPPVWNRQFLRQRTLVLFALLVVGLAPFEKTLAKRAEHHPALHYTYPHFWHHHLHLSMHH
jgi:phosphatidylglycerol lysyltransferase